MRKNLTGKTVSIIAILIIFVYGIFYGQSTPHLGSLKSLLANSIHLGLDLKGGTHLVMQVQVQEAIASDVDSDASHVRADLQKLNITGITVSRTDPAHPEQMKISGIPLDKGTDVRSALVSYEQTYDITSAADGSYTLTMKPAVVTQAEDRTLQQSINTITSRIDSLGVTQPVIEQYGLGKNQILVELPGVDDPGHVRDIIQSTARLEIHAVEPNPANPGAYYDDQPTAEQAVLSSTNSEVVAMPSIDGKWYVLDRASVVSGTDFKEARPGLDPNQRPDVEFFLTTEAGDTFYRYTSASVGKFMAIVLDGKVREAATIHDAIRDSGNINGGFTEQSAKDLSMLLSTGSLPASIHFQEERVVGPSLGAASIHQGVVAAVAGMLAVMVFMLFYYRGSGINADLALFLNLVILLGFMGFTESVLTLPGIAGVILTIGMGVDSNVLIFERIREELRAGKAASSAVDQGFAHAWITIIDTHVTTIVSAAILFIFGSGPVKGFAVTLTFGLLANLFTAVFVSRVIFDSVLQRKGRDAVLSI